MRIKTLSAIIASVLLVACQSTPETGSTDTIPAGRWGVINAGGLVFEDNGGICPASIGVFERFDNSTLEVSARDGSPRWDGICSYRADDIGAVITTYFYITDGRNQNQEIRDVVRAVQSREPVTVPDQESMICSDMIETVSASEIINPQDQYCAVMVYSNSGVRTYAGLTEDDGYFTKLRATTRDTSNEARALTLAAIADFYAAQR